MRDLSIGRFCSTFCHYFFHSTKLLPFGQLFYQLGDFLFRRNSESFKILIHISCLNPIIKIKQKLPFGQLFYQLEDFLFRRNSESFKILIHINCLNPIIKIIQKLYLQKILQILQLLHDLQYFL